MVEPTESQEVAIVKTISRRWLSLGFLTATLVLGTGLASPRARRLTMVVVPARYSVLQVAFDLVARYPCILVSYQGDSTTEVPLLHVWNGQEWQYVSLSDYRTARFLRTVPAQAVLVGTEADLPPVLLDATSWCQLLMNIPALDTPSLVNAFGKVFDFRPHDWQWFAQRYNLDLTDLNAEYRARSWYDRPFLEGGPFEPAPRRPAEPPQAQEEARTPAPVREVLPKPLPIAAEPPVRPEPVVTLEPSGAETSEAAPQTPPSSPSPPPGWEERAVAEP